MATGNEVATTSGGFRSFQRGAEPGVWGMAVQSLKNVPGGTDVLGK